MGSEGSSWGTSVPTVDVCAAKAERDARLRRCFATSKACTGLADTATDANAW